MKPLVIGIAGLNGSGKSTVAEYLRDTHGFTYFSIRDYLLKELDKRGLEPTRENMRITANEIRSTEGSRYLMKKIEDDIAPGENVVIESLRTVNEVTYLHDIGGILIAVDAPAQIRYDRMIQRQSETDRITYEEFVEAEHKESVSENPDVQNLPQVVAQADYILVNDTLEMLHKDVDDLLLKIKRT